MRLNVSNAFERQQRACIVCPRILRQSLIFFHDRLGILCACAAVRPKYFFFSLQLARGARRPVTRLSPPCASTTRSLAELWAEEMSSSGDPQPRSPEPEAPGGLAAEALRGQSGPALHGGSAQSYSMEHECPTCGWQGVQLLHHFRQSPHCAPAKEETHAPRRKRALPSAERDPARAAQLFFNRVRGEIGKWFLHGHIDHYLSLTELDNMRGLLRICASLTTEFIEEELQLSGRRPDPKIFESARRAFEVLPNVNTLISQRQQSIARAVPRHLGTSGEDTKGAAFFDVHALLAIMLQESAAVRKAVIAASEEWKTGALYKTRPSVLSDLVHGTRFLDWQAVCGKADESEAKDLRVVLHVWTDEFTPIDGLSQKARHHKYGAVLAALVNLPHRMRHYADHILLLALYNSRYAKPEPKPYANLNPNPP